MNPQPPPKTVDVIATLTAKYRIQEQEALELMRKALQERNLLPRG